MSLEDKLKQMREASAKKIPAEAQELMHRVTEELAASGIRDRVLSPGAKAPMFELPNQDGRPVNSEQLLGDGPLVLSFFRGRW